LIYFDTSAVVKLVVREPETVALQKWMRKQTDKEFISSQILRIELVRAVARTLPSRLARAREVLGGFTLLRVSDDVVAMAETILPPALRSMDAIHVASAVTLRPRITAFVVYDTRLAEAATALGLTVATPL
jgi:uncharacterized protein